MLFHLGLGAFHSYSYITLHGGWACHICNKHLSWLDIHSYGAFHTLHNLEKVVHMNLLVAFGWTFNHFWNWKEEYLITLDSFAFDYLGIYHEHQHFGGRIHHHPSKLFLTLLTSLSISHPQFVTHSSLSRRCTFIWWPYLSWIIWRLILRYQIWIYSCSLRSATINGAYLDNFLNLTEYTITHMCPCLRFMNYCNLASLTSNRKSLCKNATLNSSYPTRPISTPYSSNH